MLEEAVAPRSIEECSQNTCPSKAERDRILTEERLSSRWITQERFRRFCFQGIYFKNSILNMLPIEFGWKCAYFVVFYLIVTIPSDLLKWQQRYKRMERLRTGACLRRALGALAMKIFSVIVIIFWNMVASKPLPRSSFICASPPLSLSLSGVKSWCIARQSPVSPVYGHELTRHPHKHPVLQAPSLSSPLTLPYISLSPTSLCECDLCSAYIYIEISRTCGCRCLSS